MSQMEIWVTINNHKDYEISNMGKVRNRHTQEEISGDVNTAGYRRVTLYYGKKKRYFIHRLVALHFCDGYSENFVVNHIDGNKLNNKADNLEWITRSANDKHAYRKKLRISNNKTKVAKKDIQTGEIIETYESIKDALQANGMKGSNISSVCSGDRSSAGGFRWEYI